MTDLEKAILGNVNEGIDKAIKESLSAYNSPLRKMCDEVIQTRADDIKLVFTKGLDKTLKSPSFEKAVHECFEHKLAKLLVGKLEGEVEKAVEVIRRDPTIRARMILAIETIIKEKPQ